MHMQCNAPQFPIRAKVMLASIINMYKVRTYIDALFVSIYILIIFAVKWPKTTPHTLTRRQFVLSTVSILFFLVCHAKCVTELFKIEIHDSSAQFVTFCRRKKTISWKSCCVLNKFSLRIPTHAGKTEVLKQFCYIDIRSRNPI